MLCSYVSIIHWRIAKHFAYINELKLKPCCEIDTEDLRPHFTHDPNCVPHYKGRKKNKYFDLDPTLSLGVYITGTWI